MALAADLRRELLYANKLNNKRTNELISLQKKLREKELALTDLSEQLSVSADEIGRLNQIITETSDATREVEKEREGIDQSSKDEVGGNDAVMAIPENNVETTSQTCLLS